MDLTPSQLSSLNEMGIPVWELRTEQFEEKQAGVTQLVEPLLSCSCVVMVESWTNDEQAQRLLKAIMFAIGLSAEQFTVITPDQLEQLQEPTSKHKLLLVLGERFAQSLWGKSVTRGSPHNMLTSQISTVVSMSIDEILASPENKYLAWQDLLLAKKSLNI